MTDCIFCQIAALKVAPGGEFWKPGPDVAVFTNQNDNIIVIPAEHVGPTPQNFAFWVDRLMNVLLVELKKKSLQNRKLEVVAHLNGYHQSVNHLHLVAKLK